MRVMCYVIIVAENNDSSTKMIKSYIGLNDLKKEFTFEIVIIFISGKNCETINAHYGKLLRKTYVCIQRSVSNDSCPKVIEPNKLDFVTSKVKSENL